MLTLEAAMLERLRSGHMEAAILLALTVNLTAGGTRTTRLCKAQGMLEHSGVPVPALVSSISGVAYSIDPLTRAPSIGALQIDIIDEGAGSMARNLFTGAYTRGARVTLTFGDPRDALADWAPLWSGMVRDAVPQPGALRLVCEPALGLGRGKKRAGLWGGAHPYELALSMLEWAGVPAARIDTASFAYDVDPTISHYVARRAGVAWDGGEVLGIATTGVAWSGVLKGWRLNGVSAGNSDAGKLYVRVQKYPSNGVDRLHLINVHLYMSSAGDDYNKVSYGSVLTDAAGWYDLPLQAARVNVAGELKQINPAVTGSVRVYDDGLALAEIVPAADKYITCVAPMLGSEIDLYTAMQEVVGQCNASVIEREDGKVELLRWASAGDRDPAAIWGETLELIVADATPRTSDSVGLVSDIETESRFDTLINQARVVTRYLAPARTEWEDATQEVLIDLEDSQTGHSPDGVEPAIFDHEITHEWSNAVAVVTFGISDADTTIKVGRYKPLRSGNAVRNFGMAGTGGVTAGPTQAAARKASAAAERYVWLLIDDGENREIVKVGATAITEIGDSTTITDPQTGDPVTKVHSYEMTCTSVERGQLDTVAAAYNAGALVYDVTMAIGRASQLLLRHKLGCEILTCTTGLDQYAVQVGDFVKIVTSRSVRAIHEVISKDVDVLGGTIRWRLAEDPLQGLDLFVDVLDAVADFIDLRGINLADKFGVGSIGSAASAVRDGIALAGTDNSNMIATVLGESTRKDWVGPGAIDELDLRVGLLANGAFGRQAGGGTRRLDTPPDRWSLGSNATWGAGSVYFDAGAALSGAAAISINGTGNVVIAHRDTPIKEGVLYRLGAWFSLGNDPEDPEVDWDICRLTVDWLDADSEIVSTETFDDTSSGDAGVDWAEHGPHYLVSPATARYARISVTRVEVEASTTLVVDRVEFDEALAGCWVQHNATTGQSIAGAGGVLQFTVEKYDHGNCWSTSTYTAKVAGLYAVHGQVSFTDYGGAQSVQIAVQVNGTTVALTDAYIGTALAFATDTVAVTVAALKVEAGDVIRFYVTHEQVGATVATTAGRTYAAIHQLQ